jgi:hypothetical protein
MVTIAPVPTTTPSPTPRSPEGEFGIKPVDEARDKLGAFTAWRYKREVQDFFEHVDEQAFYKGLGGLVARHLGDVSPEWLEGQKAASKAAIDNAREAHDAFQSRTTKTNLVNAEARAKLLDRHTVNPDIDAPYVAPKTRNKFLRRVLPKTKQQKVENKVKRLVEQTQPEEEYVNKMEANRSFTQAVTRNVEVTKSWLSSKERELKNKKEEGKIDPIKFDHEMHKLEHMRKHMKAHKVYRKLEVWELPGNNVTVGGRTFEVGRKTVREIPDITPSQRFLKSKGRVETTRVELERLTRKHDKKLEKRAHKVNRKLIKLKDIHRTWQVAIGTDKGLKEAKRVNRDSARASHVIDRSVVDLPDEMVRASLSTRYHARRTDTLAGRAATIEDRITELEGKPTLNEKEEKELKEKRQKLANLRKKTRKHFDSHDRSSKRDSRVDVTGLMGGEVTSPKKRKKRVRTGYNYVTDRTFHSRKKIAKHEDITDVTGWM